jgi:hypothetical protein
LDDVECTGEGLEAGGEGQTNEDEARDNLQEAEQSFEVVPAAEDRNSQYTPYLAN